MNDAAAEVAVEMVAVDEESALESAVPAVDDYAVEVGVAGGLDAASADELVAQLAEWVRAGEGLSLVGEGGLLAQLTRRFVETAAEGEMDAHLGYAKHDTAGRDWSHLILPGADDAILVGEDNDLRPVAQAEFGLDASDVHFHGGLGSS